MPLEIYIYIYMEACMDFSGFIYRNVIYRHWFFAVFLGEMIVIVAKTDGATYSESHFPR